MLLVCSRRLYEAFILGHRLRAYWGTDCADTSVVRTPSRLELLYVRSQIAIAAKAFGLDAIDMVGEYRSSVWVYADVKHDRFVLTTKTLIT